MLIKILRLGIAFFLCLIILPGCGERAVEQSRIERLEFELYKMTSRLERLDAKIDMISWSMSQSPELGKTLLENEKQKQLEKLVTELEAQVSHLNEQLSESKLHS